MRTFLQRAFLGLFLLSLPALSFAATCTPDPATGLQCPLDETSFSGPEFITGLINKVSNWLFTFLLVLAVTFIVIAAYKYLFSGGSEESVSAAHKMMLYAAVAVAVALLSRGFVVVVRSLVGASAGGAPQAPEPGHHAVLGVVVHVHVDASRERLPVEDQGERAGQGVVPGQPVLRHPRLHRRQAEVRDS